ncbi:MAG: Na/Pi cotransporter family protein [Pseudomonadales bacterium]|nr:Na/Pi cotransporter family protein [Pseudomonadales bacterium]
MLTWNAVSQLFGGLGLFLLGMWLLTEGLKLAGGGKLQHVLATWTVTKFRSFISGFTLTAIVQSSSAVTVAIIGFINAGLLDLSRSLWIIFGSNVGTTMTAWIVALIGFKFKIDAAALPAIGIGAILHLFGTDARAKSLGGALAGLGLLFLGIQILQNAFVHIEQMVDLSSLVQNDAWGMLAMVLLGLALTAAMQSSSAAMAIVLTAVSTDLLPLAAGAAAVIGANVGTTITAIIAVLKATANARRVAVAHMIFNLITALVALTLLSFFLVLVQWLQQALNLEPDAAISLALFHTVFNLLGVALMIPLEPRLSRWLLTLFTPSESQTIKPQYLDKNIISMPDLALNAAILDQQRVLAELRFQIFNMHRGINVSNEPIANLYSLISAINNYVVECSQQQLSPDIATAFQNVIHTNLELSICLDNIEEFSELQILKLSLATAEREIISQLESEVTTIINTCSEKPGVDFPNNGVEQKLAVFEQHFATTIQFVIEGVREQRVPTQTMDDLLKKLGALRRMIRHYVKAWGYIQMLLQLRKPGTEALEAPNLKDELPHKN